MLHCDLRVRWKVASDLRFRAAISEPKTPSFCGISGDLAPSTRKSLAIAIVRFWCAKAYVKNSGGPPQKKNINNFAGLSWRLLYRVHCIGSFENSCEFWWHSLGKSTKIYHNSHKRPKHPNYDGLLLVFPRNVIRIRMNSRNSLYNTPGKEVSKTILEMGGGQIVYVFLFLRGKRETHKQNSQCHAEGGATKGGVSKCEQTQTNADKRWQTQANAAAKTQANVEANASKRGQTQTNAYTPLYCGFLHPPLQSP